MRAGSSRVEITPPKGIPMGGYIERTEPAEGVHDPLFARALVLDDGTQRVAVVTADLMAIQPSVAAEVRRRIEQEAGIPASHALIALSHTHSGPLTARRRVNTPDALYLEEVQQKLVAVACAAAQKLRPARIGAGRAKVYLGVNCRMRAEDGRIVVGKNPAGYASPFTRILVVAEEGGGPIAVLFTYGAHPVVLGPDNLQISGDYPGYAERVVEENFGDKAVALFALGFAGNVDANHEERDFEEVETFGTALGRAVIEEMKAIPLAAGLPLQARSVRVPLPLEPPPSVEEAQRMLFAERERLANILGRGEEKCEINRRRMMVEWASQLLQVAAQPQSEHAAELELQAVTIGRTALVALSAEVFAEYGKFLQEVSPFEQTLAISNANGSIGYLPTAAAFAEGGYAVETAPRLFGPLRFRPDIEPIIRQAIASLLTDMAAPRGL